MPLSVQETQNTNFGLPICKKYVTIVDKTTEQCVNECDKNNDNTLGS